MPRFALPLLSVLVFTACKQGDGSGATWTVDLDVPDASVSGVWGATPDDVWAVGGDAGGGRAWRYDGAAWAEVELPEGTPMLVWAWGSAADDVWMVGEQGGVIRWDGADFRSFETSVDQALWGVWGSGPDDVWMVGGDVGGITPTVLHTDGIAVVPFLLGTQINPRQATSLFKVWGIDGRVFAVGENGLIVEWTGEAWIYSPTGADADEDFVSLWGTGRDDVVAVGGRNTPRIGRWDGTEWTITKPDPQAVKPLNAVFVNDDGSALIGGLYGYTGTLGADGVITAEPLATDLAIHALWGDGASAWYGVGGTFVEPHRGVILRRTAE